MRERSGAAVGRQRITRRSNQYALFNIMHERIYGVLRVRILNKRLPIPKGWERTICNVYQSKEQDN